MKPTLTTKPTPVRMAVLKQVRDLPGHWAHGRGSAVNHCWRLCWINAAKNARGEMIGHQITDAGRAILSAHELSQISKPQPTTPEQHA